MAGSSMRSPTPPSDPVSHPGPTYSSPNRPSSRRLLGAKSGRVPHAECRLVEVHGVKVASFTVNGSELICLPQVFELFLKHLVGGLHTVYTKLKRLDISPVVCTVEQVRVLRGLGAIQPGVNRCKLIRRTDFETLYRDCTSASSRPGRPPKRTLCVANMTDSSRLLPHAMAEALKIHKMRMMIRFHGDQQEQLSGFQSDNEDAEGSEGSWEKEQRFLSPPSAVAPPAGSLHLSALQQDISLLASRLTDLPFMVMPHPLLPVGLPSASVAMAMNQMTQLSDVSIMTAASQAEENQESPKGSPSPTDDGLHLQGPTSQSPSFFSSSSPSHSTELDKSFLPLPLLQPANEKLPPSISHTHCSFTPLLLAEGLSMERLLTNVQGLLKVAVESAHSQSKQIQLERKELKLELDRERDARQKLQRQLSSELQTQVMMQKRLNKEKMGKRKLLEALDLWRKREQVERSITSE